ncbi:glycogen/starch/alpha-glucan phosphorylase [Desulfogranum marinum]|uniref:glycogen/starch/alpha-glucan phosphorylase n=1 Tax=Desulfogranum marinum TaxID=453220 RepID=UPI0029C751C5|nr:glycogen/starch/alpha-glucan phosphorylase [Desulfogranum marinum]
MNDLHKNHSLQLLPAPNNHNTGINKLKRALAYKLFYQLGKTTRSVSLNDYYLAAAYTLRDRMQPLFINSSEVYFEDDSRIVSYLSAEYLPGPHLHNNLINMDLLDAMRQAVAETGLDLDAIFQIEEEPGLGNGGLGRLAACFMDSLATLQVPAIGYGIRYEFGLFDQELENGWQVELSDRWLQGGNPWEIKKADLAQEVGFGGRTEAYHDQNGNRRIRWLPARVISGIPYDTPIPGYKVNTMNTLRLWSAEAPKSFDFEDFNVGDYIGAVAEKISAENITKVLYPNDKKYEGKRLRLEQQYFFSSCSLQDMLRIHLFNHDDLDSFHQSFAVQLNDTHPAIAVAELMRLLIDVHLMEWDKAWHVTTRTFSYTNHTLLPESLEKWQLPLFASLLPRHLEIIFEINRRFLDTVRLKFPGNQEIVTQLSIIDETGPRYVRMANLACVGSHTINGVSSLHTKLLKERTLAPFNRLWPGKIIGITNGVTPRRWMLVTNHRLSNLISKTIGESWITNLEQLAQLAPLADDADFRKAWHNVRLENKKAFSELAKKQLGITLNPYALFDVHVKRIHEYKRQHLNLLHIITLYNRLKEHPEQFFPPRVFIFGGKAAPGYWMAKLIIKLINAVAAVINSDPDVRGRLKVIFVHNYNVKTGHNLFPVADLSEQLSLAGTEASGTGNIKFSMNGALTIGTLDGANAEIREEVGTDQFFLFGLNVQEAADLVQNSYRPLDYYNRNPELKKAIDLISSGHFSHGDQQLFKPVIDELLYNDRYLLMADYESYINCHDKIGSVFEDHQIWTRMSILNVARMGRFSSDRAIQEYCRSIWHVEPFPVELKWKRIPEGGIIFPIIAQ